MSAVSRKVFMCVLIIVSMVLSFSDGKRKANSKAPKNDAYTSDTYYVDYQNGKNQWSGKLPQPNQDMSDGPVKTIRAAIIKLRKNRGDDIDEKVTIYLRGGYHFLKRPIYMDKKDSNVLLAAYPGDDKPIISGGNKIPGSSFSKVPNDPLVWEAEFDEKCSKHVFLGNKKRLVRARKPNLLSWTGEDMTGQEPYLYIKDLLVSIPDVCDMEGSGGFHQRDCPDENKNGFVFKSGDIDPSWFSPSTGSTGEITVFQSWNAERGRISNITKDVVLFDPPLRYPIGKHPKPSGWRYIVENIRTELDAEGEFFCDEKSKKLFVIVPEGTFPKEDVFVSHVGFMFRIMHHAENIAFSGIEFRHSHDFNFAGFNPRPAVLDFYNVQSMRVENCAFINVGYTAIYIESATNIEIINNKIEDVGYFGVVVEYRKSVPNRGDHDNNPDANKNILINDNVIKGCGVMNMLQPSCILVKGVRNIQVKNNDVSRSVYAAIRVGWQSTFKKDHVTGDQKVFYIHQNHIHDYGLDILNDFGGVYLAANPDCAQKKRNLDTCHLHASVSKNVVHSSSRYFYGGLGISADSAASSLTVADNWLYDLASSPHNFNCGLNNKAINNMIYHGNADCIFDVCEPKSNASYNPQQIITLKHNVVYVTKTDARLWRPNDEWSNEVPDVNNNVYFQHPFSANDFEVFFPNIIGSGKGQSFQAWQDQSGNDADSIVAEDALYESIGERDFRLKPNSPAVSIGIKSVDLRWVREKEGRN